MALHVEHEAGRRFVRLSLAHPRLWDGTQADDLLLRDANLPLLVLDLMMCPARLVRAIATTS